MAAWQKESKKMLYLLNIGDFAPKITRLTMPLLEAYAAKIHADIHIIKERKFPEWPVTYEKLQIFELAQQHQNDWNIYLDLDTLVHPDTPDLTHMCPRDTVAHFGADFAPVRWCLDQYFKRDGRYIGSGNWMAVASDLCLDLWRPLDDLTPEEAIANIQPTANELASGMFDKTHLVDDYTLSRNIARFGLKFVKMRDQFEKAGYAGGGGFFYHHYLINEDEKAGAMMQLLIDWKVKGITDLKDLFPTSPVEASAKIPGMMLITELEWLAGAAARMKTIVEIGSYLGRSTHALCSAASEGKVYAVDPHTFGHLMPGVPQDTFATFMQNVGHFNNLVVVRATSEQAAARPDIIPEKVEMTFIDGLHTKPEVRKDLELWAPRTTKLICGHDYGCPTEPGVKEAVDEYFGADAHQGAGTLWYVDLENVA